MAKPMLTTAYQSTGSQSSLRSHNNTRQYGIIVFILWLAVMVSALTVVYLSYDVRLKVNDLEVLRVQQDDLQIVWSQYLLEESAWASFGRVEKAATETLLMKVPATKDMVMVASHEK